MNSLQQTYQEQASTLAKELLYFSMKLDNIDWEIDAVKNLPTTDKVQKIYSNIMEAFTASKEFGTRLEWLKAATNHNLAIYSEPSLVNTHVDLKLDRLRTKFNDTFASSKPRHKTSRLFSSCPPSPSHSQPLTIIPQASPKQTLGLESHFNDKRKYRITIIDETLNTLKTGYYINSKGEKVILHLDTTIQLLQVQTNKSIGIQHNSHVNTQLFLNKKDCLTISQDCVERGLNPIVLDDANNEHFGGAYLTGGGAQEENICRRSGLSIAVDTKQGQQKTKFYPFKKQEDAGLYVARVPVFRGEEEHEYPYLDKPFEIGIAIVAAYNFNELHNAKISHPIRLVKNEQGELRLPESQAAGTKNKLRTVLSMAETKGHDSVVLVPLGCGVHCNPPKHISEILMELITEEFAHSFKEIHISIIDNQNTAKPHNPRGTFTHFKETLESEAIQTKLRDNKIAFQMT